MPSGAPRRRTGTAGEHCSSWLAYSSKWLACHLILLACFLHACCGYSMHACGSSLLNADHAVPLPCAAWRWWALQPSWSQRRCQVRHPSLCHQEVQKPRYATWCSAVNRTYGSTSWLWLNNCLELRCRQEHPGVLWPSPWPDRQCADREQCGHQHPDHQHHVLDLG